MSGIDIAELKKILPQLVRENDEFVGAIIRALSGVVATREDIREQTAEFDKRFEAMDKRFEAMDKRFEAMDKRFEIMDKRFEAMDKKFEAMQVESNRRFEAMDKKFEAMQAESNRRFEAMDKKFEAMQAESNRRFEAVDKRFDAHDKKFEQIIGVLESIQSQIGKPFEQFARNVVIRILEGEGIKNVRLNPLHLTDTEGFVSKETTDVEIDGHCADPPIIVEITSILRDTKKIQKFLLKKVLIEKVYNKKYRGFFVASGSSLTPEEHSEMLLLLKKNGAELINL
jgi:hypothetical protein